MTSAKDVLAVIASIAAILVMPACNAPSERGGDTQTEHSAVIAFAEKQAITLGGLRIFEGPEFSEFDAREGADAGIVLGENFTRDIGAIDRDVMAIYTEVLTPQELGALEEFYSSPEGKSIADKTPELYARLAGVGERYARKALAPPAN